MARNTTDADRRLKSDSFSVYRDDSRSGGMDRIFAVLDTPGPETPRGALALAQAATDAAVAAGDLNDLMNGDSREEIGTVTYRPTGARKPDPEVITEVAIRGVMLQYDGDGGPPPAPRLNTKRNA